MRHHAHPLQMEGQEWLRSVRCGSASLRARIPHPSPHLSRVDTRVFGDWGSNKVRDKKRYKIFLCFDAVCLAYATPNPQPTAPPPQEQQMAVACCDAVRLACDELRTSAELNDTTVARAEGQVRQNPDDEGAKDAAADAYQNKCEALNKFLEKNVPIIEEKLQEARAAIKTDAEKLTGFDHENGALKRERKMLKEQLEEAKAANAAAKLEESTLINQLNDATKAAATARKAASQYEEKGPFEYHPDQGKLFIKLTDAKLNALRTLEAHRVTFNHRCTAPKPHGHGYGM